MRLRRLSVLLISLLLTLILSAPSWAWKFASIADSRGLNNGVNTATLSKIVNRINSENVDLVIFQGDAVDGTCIDSCLSSQMDTWLSVMNALNCRWYFTCGNHEIYTTTSQSVILRSKVDQPLNGPAGDEEMVYSFDHNNAHFVSLNSDHYGLAGHVQRSWLATDLANTTQPHIFVYAHQPAYPAGPHIGTSLDKYPTERDDFWNIITNAGVRMFFCGHEHLYKRSLHGSIYQVINGSCGAPLYTGVPGTIGQYQYVIVTVDGNNVSCEARNDDGVLLDTWSYTATPFVSTNCDSAKHLPDGTNISLSNKVVTCVRDNAIYVEEDDRSAAFKITGTVSGISVKDKVSIYGSLYTNPNGEREIQGSATKLSSNNQLPRPLLMTTQNVLAGTRGLNPGAKGGVGLNNSALLVKIAGKVTSIGTAENAGMFYVDDGAGTKDGTEWDAKPNVGVRVVWTGTVTLGQYIAVTGVVGAYKNVDDVCRLIYSTDKIQLEAFTAYNDLVYSTTAGYNHPPLKPNVTTYNTGNGSPGPSSGNLLDFTTGIDTGVTVSITQSGGVNWQPNGSGPDYGGGADCNSGTDAYSVFNPGTTSLVGVIYYAPTTGWYVDAAFTGLDPSKTYEFVTSANRYKLDGTYSGRITKYTISGADSFTNASTPGVAIGPNGASSSFITGNNTTNGYVARWTGIKPGSDGSFTVRAEAGSSEYRAYAFSAFMLKQY